MMVTSGDCEPNVTEAILKEVPCGSVTLRGLSPLKEVCLVILDCVLLNGYAEIASLARFASFLRLKAIVCTTRSKLNNTNVTLVYKSMTGMIGTG
jgi:hypothetical protein